MYVCLYAYVTLQTHVALNLLSKSYKTLHNKSFKKLEFRKTFNLFVNLFLNIRNST